MTNTGTAASTPLVDYSVVYDWGSYYTGSLTFENAADQPLDGWEFEFVSPVRMVQFWGAQVVSETQITTPDGPAYRYVLQDVYWNTNVPSDGSATFYFNVFSPLDPSLEPHDFELNGEPLGQPPTPDTTAPTASLAASDLTDVPGSPYQFTVTYSDDRSIDASSLDTGDVRVTGPNGFSQLASFVSANPSGNGSPRTATYQISAPGGSWDEDDDGTYQVRLLGNQVQDTSGNAASAATLGSFTVDLPTPDTTAPEASLTASDITDVPTAPYQFTVRYSDDGGIDASTLGTGDVRVTGPNGFSQLASFVSANPSGNGSPRTATYQVSAPGGSWDEGDDGTYQVRLLGNQVQDTSGNAASATTLGSFNVDLPAPPVETTPPDASLSANNVTSVPSTPYRFTVAYSDDTSVDTATLGTGDVRVTGPNGFSQLASFIGVSPSGNGSPRTATYEISAPGGSWGNEDNGAYQISLLGNQVRDTNGNTAPAETLGQFNVNLAGAKFRYGEALQKSFLFYEAQRSGALPADNRIDWRGDSALNDGSDVGLDLSGGYYDAGDHVKFALPQASAMTMLSWGVVEYRDGYSRSGQLDEVLEAIRWGTDWLMKANVTDSQGKTKEFWAQVGDGDLDHAAWGPPETMTMARPSYKVDRQNPGSDVAAEAAAALAAASIAFRPTDATYANELLENAEQLYEFADLYRGKYSDVITDADQFYRSWNGYEDELTWGAIWLHEAFEAKGVDETQYLDKAESLYSGVPAGWTQSWSDKEHGAAILLAQETNDSRYRNDVEAWLDNWLPGGDITTTFGGLAWLNQWGALRYSANTAFLAGIYGDRINDPQGKYTGFAEDQIDYILGDNPRNSSYVVGFGNNSPQRSHHRAASGLDNYDNFRGRQPNEHILYGALVGGPRTPYDYFAPPFDYLYYEDRREDPAMNEPALDYNAGFSGSLARMYDKFGGNPLTDAELNALPGITVQDF